VEFRRGLIASLFEMLCDGCDMIWSMGRLVLLMLNTELSVTRQIFHGIVAFCRTRPDWELRLTSIRPPADVPDPVRAGAAGVIGHVISAEVAAGLSGGGVPWVNVSNYPFAAGWPVVTNDDERVGATAAAALLARGFRQFAFVNQVWGGRSFLLRGLGFARAVEAAGGRWHAWPPAMTPSDAPRPRQPVPEDLGAWLADRPRPLAVLAANDETGEAVVGHCRARGLAVPEEVAVVGVDNDDVRCELAAVPLSSVALGTRRIGYEAAAVLDRLMAGGPPPPGPVLIEPTGVVERRSSDAVAVDDPDVAAAVRFIAARAAEPIDVEDVARAVAVGRRALERRFRAALGRSPHDEIQRAHVGRASRLLA